jgi:hypothetical protein
MGTAALVASCAAATRAQDPDLSALMAALNSMTSARTNRPAAEAVNYRDLHGLLPESIGAYRRMRAVGETTNAMGLILSQVEGRYESGPARLQIRLADYVAMGLAPMLAAAWAARESDRTSDSRFERPVLINGCRGWERYDAEAKYGDLQILVADRFLVEIEIRDADPDDMRAALAALDLERLAALGK